MKNLVSSGGTMTVIALVAVVSGGPVLVGKLVGIAGHSAEIGDELVVHLVGEYQVNKVAAQAWTLGAILYWDATASLVTTTVSTNVQIGHASAAAANPSDTGLVRLAAA